MNVRVLRDSAASHRTVALEEANRLTTGDRNNQYGHPSQDFERIAALWGALGFRVQAPDGSYLFPAARHVALAMMQLKASRLVWQPKADSWVDAAGYAACGYEVDVLSGMEPVS